MIADIMTNQKFQATMKELLIRCRKLNISLIFITQSYFSVPKEVRLNSTYYLIMKIHNKRELKQSAIIIQQILTKGDLHKILLMDCFRGKIWGDQQSLLGLWFYRFLSYHWIPNLPL